MKSKLEELIEKLCPNGVEWKKTMDIKLDSFWLMPATPVYVDKGIPYITSKHIKNGKINFDNVNYISEIDYENISTNRNILIGDILITMIGTIGEIAIVNENRKFYGQNLYLVRLNNEKIMNKYFYYFIMSIKNSLVTRKNTSNQGYIKAGNIENLEIPLPPLEIQEEIVRILDKFTELTTEIQTELATELTLRKQQYEYYRDKLLSEEYLIKNSFNNILLKKTTLGEIGEFTRGNGLQKKDFREKGKPVIHYGEIYTKYGFSTEKTISFTEEEIYNKLRKAKKNDILMATTSENVEDVGKCVVWRGKEEIGFSGDMYKFTTEENSKYIAYYFQTEFFQRQKRHKVTGTKVIRIHADDMKKFEIILPTIEIQNRVVEVLDKFQKLINETKGLLPEEIEDRKKQYKYYREKLLTFEEKCDRTNERTNER